MRKWRWMSLIPGIALFATSAHAAAPASLRIVGDEHACPTASQLASLVAPLLPASKISTAGGPPGAEDVAVFDDGSGFRVVVAGQERSFFDPSRECLDRARHAAVFVALTLDPPAIASAKAPPREVRPEPVEPAPARVQSSLDAQLGTLFQFAPATGTRKDAAAVGLGARVRWGRQLFVSGGAGLALGSLHFATVDAQMRLIPVDLAAGLNIRSASYEVSGELGPVLSVLGIIGQRVPAARQQWRADVGARVAVTGRAYLGERIGLFLSAYATVFPRPYDLVIEPVDDATGRVGTTPSVWWGGSGGLFFRIE